MDRSRKWRFGFDEYYDVYIWDASPGRPYVMFQKKIEEVRFLSVISFFLLPCSFESGYTDQTTPFPKTLSRALRVRNIKDMYSAQSDILKTITRDSATERVRSIKPGEEVTSIWDMMTTQAQAALRRVIEQYTKNVRFCIICNYVNKIVPAIQSRCTRFRFSPLPMGEVEKRLNGVIEAEGYSI